MKDFETIKEYAAYFQGWEAATHYTAAFRDGLRAASDIIETLNDHVRKGKKKVAVVHCGDCIYYVGNNGGRPTGVCKWREDEDPDPDDFCSVGEKESEE